MNQKYKFFYRKFHYTLSLNHILEKNPLELREAKEWNIFLEGEWVYMIEMFQIFHADNEGFMILDFRFRFIV